MRWRRGGRVPLEGTEAQGRLGLLRSSSVAATDFHGDESPEGGRGHRTALVSGSVRADARRARLVERPAPCRGRGILRRAKSHERCRLKHGGEVSGGMKRQEGRNPEGAA
jgi:hypothetical protein